LKKIEQRECAFYRRVEKAVRWGDPGLEILTGGDLFRVERRNPERRLLVPMLQQEFARWQLKMNADARSSQVKAMQAGIKTGRQGAEGMGMLLYDCSPMVTLRYLNPHWDLEK
jgi:hypothetical protein